MVSPPRHRRPDRVVHGDQLGAVGEGRFDLDRVDHLGDAVHQLVAGQDVGAGLHQVGDAAPVARALDDEVADQGDGLGMVQLDAAFQPPPRDLGRHGDQKLVLLTWAKVHPMGLRLVVGRGSAVSFP